MQIMAIELLLAWWYYPDITHTLLPFSFKKTNPEIQ
jgi:hypothetical protein